MSSDNNIFYSADYSNKAGTVEGLFDRIINIKFTRKNGETFTLHSDYEPVWEGGNLRFKTCQPKPEIRVQYTQYQGVMINVDIYVTNLNVQETSPGQVDQSMIDAGISALTTSAKQGENVPQNILNRLGNSVVGAEIEIGYRGQFYNWAKHTFTQFSKADDYRAFQNLQRPGKDVFVEDIIETQDFFKAHRRCNVVIEWATNITNPPDRITQFHGYVGASEAGFQPFALVSLDCASEAGATGKLTQQDIYKGLDDEYYKIDEVSVTELRKFKEGGTPFDLLLHNDKGIAFRNFFNGGKGFTLLEGYCFHSVTRRFIRSDVDVKRYDKLEQAALEYATKTKYSGTASSLSALRDSIEQKIYPLERQYYPTYFSSADTDRGIVKILPSAPASFTERMEKSITAVMVDYFIGARFTIKNLPEYRKLYLAIRQKLAAGAKIGKYLTWWDAAKQLSSSSLSATEAFNKSDQNSTVKTREEVPYTDDIENMRYYLLKLETGELAFKDCYLNNLLATKDWIIPVQNISTSVPMRNGDGQYIKFKPPVKADASSFTTLSSSYQQVKCFTGMLEVRDAYMFGVPILCSEEASSIFKTKHSGDASVELQFFKEPQAQVEWICSTWGFKYFKLHNGGFYIYAKGETARDTSAQEFVTSQSYAPFKIPAIYDMMLSPVRKIKMPFVAFLNPMTLIEWNSSAVIGSMISFYYQPENGRNFFMVISNAVDFSTVGDFNTMELEVVDTQWVDKTDIPAAIITQDTKQTYIDVIIFPDDQNNTWNKIYEGPMTKIPLTLRSLWKSDAPEDYNHASSNWCVSDYQFFTLFESWNPSLFAEAASVGTGWPEGDGRKRIDKQANLKHGTFLENTNFPDITYCLNKLTDSKIKTRIYAKFPMMHDEAYYTSSMSNYDDTRVLVYQSGVWKMYDKTEFSDITIGAS